MSGNTYVMCGHPVWSNAACQTCDACRDGRAYVAGVMRSAQHVVAVWENDINNLEPAVEELRAALDHKTVTDKVI